MLERLLSYYNGQTNKKMAKEIANDETSHLYDVIYKELNGLSEMYNRYFDIRHTAINSEGAGKREILKDPKIIEYLYNRIYAITYLCRFYTYDKVNEQN